MTKPLQLWQADSQSTSLLDLLVASTCHSHRFLQHTSIHKYQQTSIIKIYILLPSSTIWLDIIEYNPVYITILLLLLLLLLLLTMFIIYYYLHFCYYYYYYYYYYVLFLLLIYIYIPYNPIPPCTSFILGPRNEGTALAPGSGAAPELERARQRARRAAQRPRKSQLDQWRGTCGACGACGGWESAHFRPKRSKNEV